MTIKKNYSFTMQCDIDDCTAWFFSNRSKNVTELKRNAVNNGWTIFKDSVRSYHQCPDCTLKASVFIEGKKVGE